MQTGQYLQAVRGGFHGMVFRIGYTWTPPDAKEQQVVIQSMDKNGQWQDFSRQSEGETLAFCKLLVVPRDFRGLSYEDYYGFACKKGKIPLNPVAAQERHKARHPGKLLDWEFIAADQ